MGAPLYGIVLYLLPSLPSSWSSAVYLLCIAFAYVVLKKRKQAKMHKHGEMFSTAEERNEWFKIHQQGLLRFVLSCTVRFGFWMSIVFFIGIILSWYIAGKNITAQNTTKLFMELFGLSSAAGCGLGIFTWWDNQDNEKEWLHYHNSQKP